MYSEADSKEQKLDVTKINQCVTLRKKKNKNTALALGNLLQLRGSFT